MFREITETLFKNPDQYKGIAILWSRIGDVEKPSPSYKGHYSPIIQLGVDHLVEQAESAKKIEYKITLNSLIQQCDNEWKYCYSDSITEVIVDGHICLLFEGTPYVAPGSVDKNIVHKKHSQLLDKIHEATKDFDFNAVFYRGEIKSMGENCDMNQARWKLIFRLNQYVGFKGDLIKELSQSCAIHHPAWDIVGKDGYCKTERTIREILSTRPIFHKNEIEDFISFYYSLQYNVVRGKPELCKSTGFVELDDYKFNSILREVINRGGKLNTQYLRQLLVSDFVKQFDPFKKYFSSLPAWDKASGDDPIVELASKVKTTDDIYFLWCLKRWLVGAVATVLDENATNHQVLVLSGAQGSGKTTYLKRLLPPKLDGYAYSGPLDPASKDSLSFLAECFLINLDELDSLSRSKEAALKELITKDTIKYRRVYGHYNENYIRKASFTGSVNHEAVLSDSSGNRRFLVHKTISVDYKHNVDIDLVWAQAYSLYKSGFKYWFDGADIDRIQKQNESFNSASPEEELLLSSYKKPASLSNGNYVALTATDILRRLHDGNLPSNSNSAVIKLGQALAKHGFEHQMTRGSKKWLVEEA